MALCILTVFCRHGKTSHINDGQTHTAVNAHSRPDKRQQWLQDEGHESVCSFIWLSSSNQLSATPPSTAVTPQQAHFVSSVWFVYSEQVVVNFLHAQSWVRSGPQASAGASMAPSAPLSMATCTHGSVLFSAHCCQTLHGSGLTV